MHSTPQGGHWAQVCLKGLGCISSQQRVSGGGDRTVGCSAVISLPQPGREAPNYGGPLFVQRWVESELERAAARRPFFSPQGGLSCLSVIVHNPFSSLWPRRCCLPHHTSPATETERPSRPLAFPRARQRALSSSPAPKGRGHGTRSTEDPRHILGGRAGGRSGGGERRGGGQEAATPSPCLQRRRNRFIIPFPRTHSLASTPPHTHMHGPSPSSTTAVIVINIQSQWYVPCLPVAG